MLNNLQSLLARSFIWFIWSLQKLVIFVLRDFFVVFGGAFAFWGMLVFWGMLLLRVKFTFRDNFVFLDVLVVSFVGLGVGLRV